MFETKSSEGFKRNALYDSLLGSIDKEFRKNPSIIPEDERVFQSINLSREEADQRYKAHLKRLMEKYGTTDGVVHMYVNFGTGRGAFAEQQGLDSPGTDLPNRGKSTE
jgi:hypothetical protein